MSLCSSSCFFSSHHHPPAPVHFHFRSPSLPLLGPIVSHHFPLPLPHRFIFSVPSPPTSFPPLFLSTFSHFLLPSLLPLPPSSSSLFPFLFCLPQSLKNTLLVAAGSRRRSSDRTENTVWSTARPAYKSPIEERKAVEERQCTDQEPVDKSKKWYRWEPKPGLYSAKETP